jgi:hypothetical protein
MNVRATQNNPIEKYMLDQIAHFSKECKRLGDKGPLVEYKALIDSFRQIVTKLGGLEHEVALDALKQEFRAASRESRDAWNGIWKTFRDHRQKAKRYDAEHKALKKAVVIADLEKSYANLGTGFPEMKAAIDSCRNAMELSTNTDLNPGAMWRFGSWHFLLADLYRFTIYVRYYIAKGRFFLFRHSFTIVTSIIVLGVVMSVVLGELKVILSEIYPQLTWTGIAVVFIWGWVKKYYVDPKIKRLEKKLETRRLLPLAFHLHIVRTMALYSKTAERKKAAS